MAWVALGLAIVCVLVIRWRLLDLPLDRDEGEYAYIAQQMLRGVPPYASGYAMKMPGIYIAYAGLSSPRQGRALLIQLAVFSLGAAVPLVLVIAAMWAAGVLDKFWFWTVIYAREYTTLLPLSFGLKQLQSNGKLILASFPFIWLAAVIGLAALLLQRALRTQAIWLLSLLIFSAWAVSLGFYFRPHYFILAAPVAAVLAGYGCQIIARGLSWFALGSNGTLGGRAASWVNMLVVILVVSASLFMQRANVLYAKPDQVSRRLYTLNPFPESIHISQELQARMRPDESLAVLGSEPQLYFYLERRAPSPHIYMYPLMEEQPFALQMQKEFAQDLEQAQPDWVVYSLTNGSWLSHERSELWILGWIERFLADYERVGAVHIFIDRTIDLWDDDARRTDLDSPAPVLIFRRKATEPTDGA